MFRVNLFDLSESGPMKRFRPSSERFPEDAPSGPLDSAVHPRSTRAARSMPPSPRIRSQRSARNDLICNGSLLTYLPLWSQRSPETTRAVGSMTVGPRYAPSAKQPLRVLGTVGLRVQSSLGHRFGPSPPGSQVRIHSPNSVQRLWSGRSNRKRTGEREALTKASGKT